MADPSQKPLVGELNAQKAVVAEHIEHLHINITRGLDELPTRYDSRVQNFLEYYFADALGHATCLSANEQCRGRTCRVFPHQRPVQYQS